MSRNKNNQILNNLLEQPYIKSHVKKQNGNKSKNLIPASKRLTITYVVFAVWVGLAIFGILMNTDLISLSVYFASGLPLIIGYLWSETSRPSGSIKDISKLIEAIMLKNYEQQEDNTPKPNPDIPTIIDNKIIIIADDNSDKIEIKESELYMLLNSGYVTKNKGKYTFNVHQKSEITSLINGDEIIEQGIYNEEEASI